MKKLLFITNVVVINTLLLSVCLCTINPFNLSVTEIINNGIEWLFSPNPIYNIIMILSFISLIIFNINLIVDKVKFNK
jgi:hypothetical protein